MRKHSQRYHQKKPHRERHQLSKTKSHKNEEDLRGEIKKLKSIIRNLQKRLRYYEKVDHMLEDAIAIIEADKEREYEQELKADRCPDCRKGELRLVDLGRISYTACNQCSYRVKSHGEKKE